MEPRKSMKTLASDLKAIRQRPVSPEFIEKFNKLQEDDDRAEREQREKEAKRKIAQAPEANS